MDIKLIIDNTRNSFDIALSGGDLATSSGLLNAVLLSLFTDRRAANDDIIPDGTDDPRGCYLDIFDDHIKGSRLWLLSREKQTAEVLRDAKEYSEEALQWLLDENVVTAITVTTEWQEQNVLAIRVIITLKDKTQFNEVFNYPLLEAA